MSDEVENLAEVERQVSEGIRQRVKGYRSPEHREYQPGETLKDVREQRNSADSLGEFLVDFILGKKNREYIDLDRPRNTESSAIVPDYEQVLEDTGFKPGEYRNSGIRIDTEKAGQYNLSSSDENPDAQLDDDGLELEDDDVFDEYKNDDYMDLTGDGEIITDQNGRITGKGAQSHKSSEGL